MSIVQAIESVLVTRPAYDDTNLGNEQLWILDNAKVLANYWQTLGRFLGVDDPEGEEDLELFISEQHCQQMRQHPGFMYERLPHGGTL